MPEYGINRQLKAINSAEVKGYIKLMGDNNEATVKTITTYRGIIAPALNITRGVGLTPLATISWPNSKALLSKQMPI